MHQLFDDVTVLSAKCPVLNISFIWFVLRKKCTEDCYFPFAKLEVTLKFEYSVQKTACLVKFLLEQKILSDIVILRLNS